MTIIFN